MDNFDYNESRESVEQTIRRMRVERQLMLVEADTVAFMLFLLEHIKGEEAILDLPIAEIASRWRAINNQTTEREDLFKKAKEILFLTKHVINET